MKYAIFGAGKLGQTAYRVLCAHGDKKCYCWVDNDSRKWGTDLFGLPIVSLDEWQKRYPTYRLLLALNSKNRQEVVQLLQEKHIDNYEYFNRSLLYERERVVSYSHPAACEDVIIYHALHDVEDLFYIDVGSNDPVINSVTKLFYDRGAHGINLDPIKECIEMSMRERKRDINICTGIGEFEGTMTLYLNGGMSTMRKDYAEQDGFWGKRIVPMTTLTNICNKYMPKEQQIHFLKIDVEGMEEAVIKSLDWHLYRPWILCVEATLPGTDVPCHKEWEPYLLEHGYRFVFQYSVDRYYVSLEKEELADKFYPMEKLLDKYYVFQAEVKII